MSKDNRTFDLVETHSNASLPLRDFAVRIIRTAESLPKTRAGSHIAKNEYRISNKECRMMKYLFSSTFDIPCSAVRYSLFKREEKGSGLSS